MIQNNGRKMQKDTLAHCINLALKKALSSSNIMVGFRAIGIWPLNLDRMEAKMGPSKPYYFIPSKKLIVEEIMEGDISCGVENGKHYYVQDDGDVELEEGASPESTPSISQFLKLLQREFQGTRVLYEPLVDYSQSQLLTLVEHSHKMQEIAHNKSMVAIAKKERKKQTKLTKISKAAKKAFKEVARNSKAEDKEKRQALLKKWEEDDNGGQRNKILQLVQEGSQHSRHILHGEEGILP